MPSSEKYMDSNTLTLVDLTTFSPTFPDSIDNEVSRSSILDTIDRIFDLNVDIVFIEGIKGSGKTVLLTQFAKLNNFRSISHFFSPADRYSYNFEYFKRSIYDQLYFFINGIGAPDLDSEYSLVSLRSSLDKAIRRTKKSLYIILDGLVDVPIEKRVIIFDILADLPWSKIKFLVSGDYEELQGMLPNNSIRSKSHQIAYFSFSESKMFLAKVTQDDNELASLYKISFKGLPGKLDQIRRICLSVGVDQFFASNIDEGSNLLEVEWAEVQKNEIHSLILSLLAFDDFKYTIDGIAKRLKLTSKQVQDVIDRYNFLVVVDNAISFVSEHFRMFATNKLAQYREKVLGIAIDYYVDNPENEDSLLNLSYLLSKAKRYKELINLLSVDSLASLLTNHRSISTVYQQVEQGLNAAMESDRYSANFMRFSLLKSSFQEVERFRTTENEIVARISLGQYDQAYDLAIGAYLKEDRLMLLSELARQKRENKLVVESEITDQIRDLYKQVDLKNLGQKGMEIARKLLYSCPDLSVDLIERMSEEDPQANFRDIAYSELSIDALMAHGKVKNFETEIDLITTKIKDDEQKSTIGAMAGLLGDYNASQIIRRTNELNDGSKKLFFLERWILANKKAPNVKEVILKALETVITNSSDDEPSATTLVNLASPLEFMVGSDALSLAIEMFDSQRNSIIYPTEDYIKLQIILAKAVSTYNYERAKDRFEDIFIQIVELHDLPTKVNCLANFWAYVRKEAFSETPEMKKLNYELLAVLNKDMQVLLKDTAHHDKMIGGVLTYIANEDLNLAMSYIANVNTQIRRDNFYLLLLDKYLEDRELAHIDFSEIKLLFELISEPRRRYKGVVIILSTFVDRSDEFEESLAGIYFYIDYSFKIEHIPTQCRAFVLGLLILQQVAGKEKLRHSIIEALMNSWLSMDMAWYKVELGFQISGMFAKAYPQLANEYLRLAIEERETNSLVDSTAVADTYILSVSLAIRAFSGLIRSHRNIDAEIDRLEKLILAVPSLGEQARLWGLVALNFYSREKFGYFKKIVKDYVKPNLSSIGDRDLGYREFLISQISPCLFLFHSQTFFDAIATISMEHRDEALYRACYFIMTKVPVDEPLEFNEKGYPISHEDAKDICRLIQMMESDEVVHLTLARLVTCLKSHKLVPIQINDIKREIISFIDKSFPKLKYGIKHEGFKITLTAFIYSLDSYDEKKWNQLKDQAYKLPNISDSIFVLAVIADQIQPKYKKIKMDILTEAYELTKLIPSNYDRFQRIDLILETMAELSKVEFSRMTLEVGSSLQNSDNVDIQAKHKDLIDLLYQHDPSNVEKYMSVLSNDIVKKNKLKRAMEAQIKALRLRDEASLNYKNISKISRFRDLFSFSKRTLRQLNSGKITPKKPEDLFHVIEGASNYGLYDAYYLFSVYIENIVKRFENSVTNRNIDYLFSVYEATIFNTNLIDILSQDNASKVKNRLKSFSTVKEESISIFSIDDRERFETYLRGWMEENVTSSLYIIDPYFDEGDLDCLRLVKEVSPDCEVFILTSKEDGNRESDIDQIYRDAWKKISDEPAPFTVVKVIWIEGGYKSPFHDRWWIPGEAKAGLRFGSSFNSIGRSKDSEISLMTRDEVKRVHGTIVQDYIDGNVRRYGSLRLKGLSFELEE